MKWLALPTWLAGLALMLYALVSVDAPRVPMPPVGGWVDWLTVTDPVTIAFGLLRLLCAVGVGYLLLTALLVLVGQIFGGARLFEALCGQSLLQFNRRVIGLTVVGVLAVPGAAGAATEAPMLRSLTVATTTSTTIAEAAPPAVPLPSSSVEAFAADYWLVEPGDSLWSIAETVMTERQGNMPTERQVADYWLELQAENDQLDDMNLIAPGTRLVLPS